MKRYFIGDIADRLKLNPRTIRYYERIGILPNPGRTESGYRVYTEKTIERLQFILKAKVLGLKLDEIKEILLLYDKGQVPCDCTRTIINNKIIEIEDKIAALTSLKSQLQKSIQVQRGKSLSESICPIIMGSEKNS
jgi:DNA-binding transcriptional MerR regulator